MSKERGDRDVVSVVRRSGLRDQTDAVAYWLTRPVEERISAVEVLRRRVFGPDYDNRPPRGLRAVHRVSRPT